MRRDWGLANEMISKLQRWRHEAIDKLAEDS